MSEDRPEWRTPTVVALCKSMRAERNYEALPILADALEEAGFDNVGTLSSLRHAGISYRWAERHVCDILGGEFAEAVRWIDNHASTLDQDYDTIMGYADGWTKPSKWGGDYITQYDSETWRDTFDPDTFWAKYEMVTGNSPIDQGFGKPHFFSCSC